MACVAAPWYATMAQLVSHLPFLGLFPIAYKHHKTHPMAGYVMYGAFAIVLASAPFHLCDSACVCMFDTQPYILRQFDNTTSMGMGLTLVLIALASLSYLEQQSAPASMFWNSAVFPFIQFITLLFVLVTITGPNISVPPQMFLIIFTVAIAITYYKMMFADNRARYLYKHYVNAPTIIGLVLLLISVICFILEVPEYDWITHSIWHLGISSSLDLIVYGSFKGALEFIIEASLPYSIGVKIV